MFFVVFLQGRSEYLLHFAGGMADDHELVVNTHFDHLGCDWFKLLAAWATFRVIVHIETTLELSPMRGSVCNVKDVLLRIFSPGHRID